MLPLHSKHSHSNGRHPHVHSGFPFGSRVPLLICLSLVVYLVYQRYYYQKSLQEVEDKLYLSAKQTSEAQNNLMSAEQKIVNLKDVHEEDTLTISALTKKMKNAENEQQKLSAKLKHLGVQYEQIDNRFQNLSVMMTEMKASYISKLEKNKEDIENANERLLKADKTTNEYKTILQNCQHQKRSLAQLLEEANYANKVVAQNEIPSNSNINAANLIVPHRPMSHYSQSAANGFYKNALILSSGNISKINFKTGVSVESGGDEKNQDSIESFSSLSEPNQPTKPIKKENTSSMILVGNKNEKINQVSHQISPGDESQSDANLEYRKNGMPGSVDSSEELKQIGAPKEWAYGEKKSGDVNESGEDPVKEHEDIVEKVNSYLKNNIIQKT